MTTADTGIESLDQLKGRGPHHAAAGNTGEAITAHLVRGDRADLRRSGAASTSCPTTIRWPLLKDGNSEVFTLGTTVPASAIMDLASARDIKLLAVDDDAARQDAGAQSRLPADRDPAGSYPGQDEAVPTIGYATHLIARCDLPDETVTGMVAQIVDHQEDLAAVAKAIGDTTLEQMAADIGVPIHPAAAQYFKDQGVM